MLGVIKELGKGMVRFGKHDTVCSDRLAHLDVEATVLFADVQQPFCASFVETIDGLERVTVKVKLVIESDGNTGDAGENVSLNGTCVELLVDQEADAGYGDGADGPPQPSPPPSWSWRRRRGGRGVEPSLSLLALPASSPYDGANAKHGVLSQTTMP